MRYRHLDRVPVVDPDAFVAPDASLCGDVRIGAGARVMHGARLIAEGGRIAIGAGSIVLENAVIRATATHDCRIGAHVLVGPNAHLVGADIADEVFIATGAALFHGCRVGRRAEVRINAVVHVNSVLAAETTVPIGWIAAGDPAQLFSPDRHDELWAVQSRLGFAETAYGVKPSAARTMPAITTAMAERLAGHRDDTLLDADAPQASARAVSRE